MQPNSFDTEHAALLALCHREKPWLAEGQALPSTLDIQRLCDLASRYRVAGLIFGILKPENNMPGWLSVLRSHCETEHAKLQERGARYAATLRELVEILQRASIPV